MSSQNSKFNMGDSVAPYRKSIVASSSRSSSSLERTKLSFLGKIKSFFRGNLAESTTSQEINKNNKPHPVPGGFYNLDAKNSIIQLPNKFEEYDKSKENTSLYLNENEVSEENRNLSNAKLAEFFREKGDSPLTEMEYEGVLSLIQRSKSLSSTPQSNKILSSENNEIKVLRSTSERLSKPLGAPSFKPAYSESISLSNTSTKSCTSDTTRRVFDYFRLSSPYKTTFYKYSAATVPKSQESTKLKKNNNHQVRKPIKETKPTQKLSHTAAALISLLDDDNSFSVEEKSSLSEVSNPYSQHVSKINKRKKLFINKGGEQFGIKDETTEPTPVKSTALDGLSKARPSVITHSVPTESNSFNNSTSALQPIFGFKPTNPSSLRVEVTVKKSPEKQIEQPVPQSSTFDFSFNKNKSKELSANKLHIPETKAHSHLFKFQPLVNNYEEKIQTAQHQDGSEKIDVVTLSKKMDSKDNNKVIKLMNRNENIQKKAPRAEISMHEATNINTNVSSFNESIKYDFGTLPESGINPDSVKKDEVEQLRSNFRF